MLSVAAMAAASIALAQAPPLDNPPPPVTVVQAHKAIRVRLVPYLVPAFTWHNNPTYRLRITRCIRVRAGARRCRFRVVGPDFGFGGAARVRPLPDDLLVAATSIRSLRSRLHATVPIRGVR